MNTTYKHWKPNAADQEPDRPRHKLFTSSSHHKTSEIRAAGRDREDAKHRSSRGHVSDGPLLSSSTPAPTYPTGAQSSATASKASHNAPTHPSQGHAAYMSQKVALPTATLPQDTLSTAQRHWETAPDPRATSHRTVTAMDKASLMSPDPIRHAEDHHKSSRHRPRHPSSPAPESAEPQAASTWPRPPSFLKKVSPEGREREREWGRSKLKEESKATSKVKDQRRTERPQEQVPRDQRERDPRYEEERRHYKEERRREKERQREEQRQEERRHEQRVKDEYIHKSTRDQERRREAKDGHVPPTLGKDPRLMRVMVKDSDESDNSLTKRPGSIRPRRQHPRDQTMTPVVPTVLRQPTYPPVPAQVPSTQAGNNLASNPSEPRQTVTLVQPSHATLGASDEKAGMKPQRSSPPQNSTVPYPPGYAVSASDSEHVSRREHRQKVAESARLIERPRTSGGHRVSIAHDAVSKPPVAQSVQPTLDKSLHKSAKQSRGGFGAWLFHRESSSPHPKSTDPHVVDQNAAQPTGRAVLTPSTRNDTPEAIPKVVSIRAGEGPADYQQEYGVRRAAPPAVTPTTDVVARQPPSTVQVLQQTQVYDKQSRDTPRTVAGAQLDPPSHPSVTRVPSPQPWVQPAQWSTEPRPLSPAPRPPVVPSPMVFHTPLASPSPLVDTQRQLAPSRLASHGPPSHKESHIHTRDISHHSPTVNGRTPAPPAPPVHSHTVPLPTAGSGQRATPQGASPMVHDAGSKHARYSSVPVGYQPSYVTSPQSRPIAPGLAAAFPIREDNADAYRQVPQVERPQDPQPSRDAIDNWDRHRHNSDNVVRMVVSTAPSSERTPRSTKASPSLHPRPVNQGTPPKPPLQPFDATTVPLQSSTNPNVSHLHDSSRPGVYNMPNQNSNSSPYPATSTYPSSSHRTQVEANSVINNLPVASASSNNPSPKIKPGNPSPRSRSQAVASSQGLTPPAAVHLTNRTPSHETGSTTLLGQTPSSQGSVSMQLPMSPPAHPQAILPRVMTTHGGQQIAHGPAPVSDNVGDRNVNAINHFQVPTTRQTHGGQQIAHGPVPVSDSVGDRNTNAINHSQVPTTRQTHGGQQIAHGPAPVSDNVGDRNVNAINNFQVPTTRQTHGGQQIAHGPVPVSDSVGDRNVNAINLSQVPTTRQTHGGQQIVHGPAPVSDSLGDRNANAINHSQVPTTRQTSARHYHSHSAPVVSVPSLAQSSPPVQSQTQPPARPAPFSPTPIRSYPTTQTMGDFHLSRTPVPGYPISVTNSRQQRDEIPSPSQESELNTPSSLAVSTKLPIVSDEPLAPVMSSQSFQEPKKKPGFFQGLGIFRSRSSAQKQHPHESKVLDSRAQKTTTTTTTTTTKLAPSKPPMPLHYDSDSKVVTTPLKLKKSKAVHTPASAPTPKPPQPIPMQVPIPAPSFAAAADEKFSSPPNPFASFRIGSKRYRTMSGASAEANDGTNAGASTVLTSPANSTRSPTPKLIPPQRDPQQATYAWRNKEEAEARQRGKARRRRPGVHFEGYEDHPQADRHRQKYATRGREKVRT